MILIGSWESIDWAEPRPLDVHRVLPGARGWRRRYAIGSVPDENGEVRWVAACQRGRRSWRPDDQEVEALLWHLDGPDDHQGDGRFRPPDRGAAVGYVVVGDLARQRAVHQERSRRARGGTP